MSNIRIIGVESEDWIVQPDEHGDYQITCKALGTTMDTGSEDPELLKELAELLIVLATMAGES